MTDTQYGIRKATPVLPVRDLLVIPHKTGELVVSHPAFGSNTYANNLAEMQRVYTHSAEHPRITFREPTTSESISACAYDFKTLAKPEILNPRWLQIGRIVRTSEGVYANPPKDAQGNPIVDEKELKQLLKRKKKVNGIYLLDNNLAFIPYESFTTGVQDTDTFARSGLARGLEYVAEAETFNLKLISSKENYPRGVNVWGFDSVDKPVLRVAGLFSGRNVESDRLLVCGYDWIDDGDGGCAFGVLKK